VGAGPLPVTEQGLLPAEHRALRELHAMSRHLAAHWARLAERLGGEPADVLERGADATRELLSELTERTAAHDLHGIPSAQGVGVWEARLRAAGDLLLERNQALRYAVLDIQYVTTLLAYLAELAKRRDDAALAAWHRRWETRLHEIEDAARATAVAAGREPERAVEPAEPSALGRAGHAVANGIGTLGEALDGSALGRAVRRLRRP
jgi:hypothetical protein